MSSASEITLFCSCVFLLSSSCCNTSCLFLLCFLFGFFLFFFSLSFPLHHKSFLRGEYIPRYTLLASLQSMSFLFFSFLKKMSNLPKSFHSMSFICPHFTRPNSPNSSIFSKKKNFSFGLPWLGAYLEHPNSFSCLLCHHLFFFFLRREIISLFAIFKSAASYSCSFFVSFFFRFARKTEKKS